MGKIISFLVLILLLISCQKSEVPKAKIEQAQQALMPLKQNLMAELKTALQSGPENAIYVCNVRAPQIADSLQTDKIQIGRSSHKLRNPKNAPEPWMEKIITYYQENKGESGYQIIVMEDGTIGYSEPIYVKPLCLGCHGQDITSTLKANIDSLYPADQATGFVENDFRGIFWVKIKS